MEVNHFVPGSRVDSTQISFNVVNKSDFCVNLDHTLHDDLIPSVPYNYAIINLLNSLNLINQNERLSKIDILTVNESLLKGVFWKKNISRKAPPDGHCLIHSVLMCLKHCFSSDRLKFTYNGLLDKLRTESLHNMSRYLPAIDNYSWKIMVLEMVCYIYLKAYNSDFGDLVPQILSNAFSVNLFIIVEYPGDKYYVHLIEPIDKKVNYNIFLHKRDDHYDACLPYFDNNIPVNVPNIDGHTSVSNTRLNYPSSCLTKSNIENVSFCSLNASEESISDIDENETHNSSLKIRNFDTRFLNPIECQSDLIRNRTISSSDNNCAENSKLNETLINFRREHPKNLIFGYLNINSLRNKFFEVKSELIECQLLDILFLAETKLDITFPPEQFSIDGFRAPPYRRDRNKYGGGIICFVRSDIPNRRRYDIEDVFQVGVESLAIEITVRQEKWLFVGFYKPPRINDASLISSLENVITVFQHEFKSIYLMGDSNIDQLKNPVHFKDFLDTSGIANLINDSTCHKSDVGTSIDVLLTDTPYRIASVLNFDTGLSDFHHLIAACTRMHVPRSCMPVFQYRSMKYFDEDLFLDDLSKVPFHVAEIFDDPNDAYWLFDKLYADVLNRHAPIKSTRKHPKHAPFMHTELRKARNVKAMLRRKYNKIPTNQN